MKFKSRTTSPEASQAEAEMLELVKLKRLESPGGQYFANTLDRLHERQRREMMQASSSRLFLDRLEALFQSMTPRRWVAVGSVAYASLLAVGMLSLQWSGTGGSHSPSMPPLAPVSIENPQSAAPEQGVRVEVRHTPVLSAKEAAQRASVDRELTPETPGPHPEQEPETP